MNPQGSGSPSSPDGAMTNNGVVQPPTIVSVGGTIHETENEVLPEAIPVTIIEGGMGHANTQFALTSGHSYPQYQTLSVVVPPGIKPGQEFIFTYQGMSLKVTVPPNLQSGQRFPVYVPLSTPQYVQQSATPVDPRTLYMNPGGQSYVQVRHEIAFVEESVFRSLHLSAVLSMLLAFAIVATSWSCAQFGGTSFSVIALILVIIGGCFSLGINPSNYATHCAVPHAWNLFMASAIFLGLNTMPLISGIVLYLNAESSHDVSSPYCFVSTQSSYEDEDSFGWETLSCKALAILSIFSLVLCLLAIVALSYAMAKLGTIKHARGLLGCCTC